MNRKAFLWLSAAFCISTGMALPLSAQTPPKTYAQQLVDQAVAKHPEVVVLAMHVTPPNNSQNVIIASNIGRIGKKADEDDLRVIKTGKPNLALNKTGDRFEVELPLQDANARMIGALGVVFAYRPGDDKSAFQKKAELIRNELRRRISHVANLMEPAQFDQRIPINTYGQHLVEEELAKHPEVIILALHVTPPKSADNVIIASNIGRIGKKADEDDLAVIKTGVPKLELNTTGDRFEDELVLQDVSGDTIGAVGVVFPYKTGDDKGEFQMAAEMIRDELRRHITNAGNLLEPYPYSQTPTNTYAQKLVDETMARHPELQILALHITPPGSRENVILASSIGRIGKQADEDDLKVIKTGEPILEVHVSGKRFEVELQLHDASGKTIGAVSAVFAYTAGDDKAVLQKQAEQLRTEIEKKIPSVAKLVERGSVGVAVMRGSKRRS
jgi:hypothetical protein